jgi:hypothetical protein
VRVRGAFEEGEVGKARRVRRSRPPSTDESPFPKGGRLNPRSAQAETTNA